MKKYTFNYMTEIYKKDVNRRYNELTSLVELTVGDAIIIEKIGTGLFLGIVEDCLGETNEISNYRFYAPCPAGDAYLDRINKAKRKEELAQQMEKKFEEIDKERKFEYYATLDASFKELLDEYKNL